MLCNTITAVYNKVSEVFKTEMSFITKFKEMFFDISRVLS